MTGLLRSPIPVPGADRRLRGLVVGGVVYEELRATEPGASALATALGRLLETDGGGEAWLAAVRGGAELTGFLRELGGAAGVRVDAGSGSAVATLAGGDPVLGELLRGAASGRGRLLLLRVPEKRLEPARAALLAGDTAAAVAAASLAVAVEGGDDRAILAQPPGHPVLDPGPAGVTAPRRRPVAGRRLPFAPLLVVMAIAIVVAATRLQPGSPSSTPPSPAPSAAASGSGPSPFVLAVTPRRGPAPSARQGPASAWDAARGRLVLAGGRIEQGTGEDLGDTWTWDGTSWSQAAGSGPPARFGAVMAADGTGGGLLLFGGLARPVPTVDAVPREDTWRWDGRGWSPVLTDSAPPFGSRPIAMVDDPATGRPLLVTYDGPGAAPRTWSWTGHGWREELAGAPPAPLRLVCADPARRQVLAVGADGSTATAASTWAWRGGRWARLDVTRGVQVDPLSATMAPDPASGDVVLVEEHYSAAGNVTIGPDDRGGTWTWDGAWHQHSGPAPQDVGAFDVTAPVWAEPGGHLVLVGGDRGATAYRLVAAWNGAEGRWVPG